MSSYFINNKLYPKPFVMNMSVDDVAGIISGILPKKLYKYFPNIEINGCNYSIQALENNTVYLQSPIYFDDPYDSLITIDKREFMSRMIDFYAELCEYQFISAPGYEQKLNEFSFFIAKELQNGREIENIFYLQNIEDKVLHDNILASVLLCKYCIVERYKQDKDKVQKAIDLMIFENYDHAQKFLCEKFRISCFTTTPYSMLMWSHYANGHKGFCIEYDLAAIPDSPLFSKLFPVIYCDERISLIEQCIEFNTQKVLTNESLWKVFKYGLLMKSVDWKYQNEWRYISYDSKYANIGDYNCKFFPVSKVFLGNKMNQDNQQKIVNICRTKGIPFTGVTICNDKYEMQDSKIL